MNRLNVKILAITLAVAVLLSGCAGIEPYDPPNHKEEPPGSGLLTGEDGEFVINVNLDENESGRMANKEEVRSDDKNP